LTIFFKNTIVFLDYFYNYVELHRESRENILSDKIVMPIKSLSFFIQLIAKIRFFLAFFNSRKMFLMALNTSKGL